MMFSHATRGLWAVPEISSTGDHVHIDVRLGIYFLYRLYAGKVESDLCLVSIVGNSIEKLTLLPLPSGREPYSW